MASNEADGYFSPRLYNADLAPLTSEQQRWGWVSIFNVWSNTAQSLLGYTLAASLFLNYALPGWLVFVAILVAGFIVVLLVNLAGAPAVRYGIPYPVMARASAGVYGANLPALLRGVVAIFWYGAQTYIASTAISLLIRTLGGIEPQLPTRLLGMDAVDWVSVALVSAVQMVIFWRGIESIRVFLNWAAPAVYLVMLVLLAMLWHRVGGQFRPRVERLIWGTPPDLKSATASFCAIVGTMIAFYAPVILNYGDFARYVRSEKQMKRGNRIGLLANMTLFAAITLLVTAGTEVVLGERLTNPTDIIARIDNTTLTIVSSLTFFVATVGINVVANFVPPANDLSNLMPGRISFRVGGLISALCAFPVSVLWVSVISQFGISQFANTLGALLAPAYGIMVTDYYLTKHGTLEVDKLYSHRSGDPYYYQSGWNRRALVAFIPAGLFSVLGVWLPALHFLSGFSWLIAAISAGLLYFLIAPRSVRSESSPQPHP